MSVCDVRVTGLFLSLFQNPKDCSTAKKLVCNMNKGCGYGCQLHHVVYCFIIAYGTQRTFILESRGWRYSPGGWEKIFQPLSDTCTDRSGSSSRSWASEWSIISGVSDRCSRWSPLKAVCVCVCVCAGVCVCVYVCVCVIRQLDGSSNTESQNLTRVLNHLMFCPPRELLFLRARNTPTCVCMCSL